MWTAIHVRIMDFIADGKITREDIIKAESISKKDIEGLTNYMIKLLKFNYGTHKKYGAYIKARQALFNRNNNKLCKKNRRRKIHSYLQLNNKLHN